MRYIYIHKQMTRIINCCGTITININVYNRCMHQYLFKIQYMCINWARNYLSHKDILLSLKCFCILTDANSKQVFINRDI